MIKASGRRSLILIFFLVILFCCSIGFFSWLKIDAHEKQLQLNALNVRLEELKESNLEIEHLINEADEKELYERLARARGYVYPDEKVYFNVTPGN